MKAMISNVDVEISRDNDKIEAQYYTPCLSQMCFRNRSKEVPQDIGKK